MIPEPGGPAEQVGYKFFMGVFLLALVGDLLRLQPHGLLDGCELAVGDERCTFVDRIGERLFGYEGVHEAAAHCFGRTFKAFDGDISGGLAAFKLDDSGLMYAKTRGQLACGHAKCFAYGTNPSARGANRLGAERLEPCETFIELFVCCDHTIRYIL